MNREKILDRQRTYYANNKREIKRRVALYRARNRDEYLESQKKNYSSVMGHLRVVFGGMNRRCNNPKVHNYTRYGARGIKNKFKSLDDFRGYVLNELRVDPRGLQIDRIDNDGHYEKGNIRFITCKENCNNRRHTNG